MHRSYSELREFRTFDDRFDYLALRGAVCGETFGHRRYLNQNFYSSRAWRRVRNIVIDRDMGCDLGIEGYEIHKGLFIHHMNPISVEDLIEGNPDIIDPEFLITVTHDTHNAIHYGAKSQLPRSFVERTPGDTWI